MSDTHVVILAAGKGTRMKSALPKVLHQVAGAPMIDYVLAAARPLAPATVTVVVGHEADSVRDRLEQRCDVRFVLQEPQLGTGHALRQTERLFAGTEGTLVLLYGDVPLLTAATLERLVETHRFARAAATVLTAEFDDPTGYGRIVREHGEIARIVEERDATGAERPIREVNAGIYAFDIAPLFPSLAAIAPANAQREYYLPDLVGIYRHEGRTVGTVRVGDAERDPRRQQPQGAGTGEQDRATAAQRRVDGGGRDDRGSGDDLRRPRRRGRRRHGPAPRRLLEGRTRIGATCEIHATSGLSIRQSATG